MVHLSGICVSFVSQALPIGDRAGVAPRIRRVVLEHVSRRRIALGGGCQQSFLDLHEQCRLACCGQHPVGLSNS